MAPLKTYLIRRLTARKAITAILVAGLLAGLAYFTYLFTAAKMLDARVNAAIPTICDDIRHQRSVLVNALAAYKAQFGAYPPDHVIRRQPTVVDPITNTLLYELTGVLYNPATRKFQVAGLEPAEEDYVTNFFQCQRFRNCSERQEQLKHLLAREDVSWRQLHDDPDVFALSCGINSPAVAPELMGEIYINSWRFVSSSPTNNVGKFDLWIELKHKGRTIIIGNWKEVE